MVVGALANAHGVVINQRKFRSRFGQCRIDQEDVFLVRPFTYMNLSGAAVGQWVKHLGEKMSCCIVIHDDLDLPFGRIRVRRRGSHGGHRGVQSIIDILGTGDFIRIKIGIGRPADQPPELYVLQSFTLEERRRLAEIISRGCEAVEAIIKEGVEFTMNRFNALMWAAFEAEAE